MDAERGAAPEGVGEERLRECLDAVLWATQQADEHTSHVCMALPIMDDVARVLEAARLAAGPGAEDEVGRLQEWLTATTEGLATATTEAAWLRGNLAAAEARAEAAERERERLRGCYAREVLARREDRRENDRLRTLLADGPGPCIYCGLAAADLARCASGFPGCGRVNDMTPPDGADQAEIDRSGDNPIPNFAGQIGGTAREGGAVIRDFRTTGDGTTPDAEGGHGRG